MKNEDEVVWDGRSSLTDSLERDYADMKGDGWDLIYTPPSPLTTPWWEYAALHQPDPERHVMTEMDRRSQRKRAPKILKDWTSEYTGEIAQQGRHR